MRSWCISLSVVGWGGWVVSPGAVGVGGVRAGLQPLAQLGWLHLRSRRRAGPLCLLFFLEPPSECLFLPESGLGSGLGQGLFRYQYRKPILVPMWRPECELPNPGTWENVAVKMAPVCTELAGGGHQPPSPSQPLALMGSVHSVVVSVVITLPVPGPLGLQVLGAGHNQ